MGKNFSMCNLTTTANSKRKVLFDLFDKTWLILCKADQMHFAKPDKPASGGQAKYEQGGR